MSRVDDIIYQYYEYYETDFSPNEHIVSVLAPFSLLGRTHFFRVPVCKMTDGILELNIYRLLICLMRSVNMLVS